MRYEAVLSREFTNFRRHITTTTTIRPCAELSLLVFVPVLVIDNIKENALNLNALLGGYMEAYGTYDEAEQLKPKLKKKIQIT